MIWLGFLFLLGIGAWCIGIRVLKINRLPAWQLIVGAILIQSSGSLIHPAISAIMAWMRAAA